MKTASAPLIALFASSRVYCMADLYTITLRGGTVIRWTSHDAAITFGGNTFTRGPLLEREGIRATRGIETSELKVTITPDDNDTINGVGLIPFARGRGLDGASVKLERIFGDSWSNLVGTLIMFSGRVGPIDDIGAQSFDLTVVSWTELLDQNVPPDLIQPECLNTLFDTKCGLTKATYAVTNAVTASPAPTDRVFDTTLAQAAGYFDQGTIIFTSGANSGLSRTIRSNAAGGLITLVLPLPVAPATGDTFTIYPGCDRTKATCSSKFSNLLRFRGQPFVPTAESAV